MAPHASGMTLTMVFGLASGVLLAPSALAQGAGSGSDPGYTTSYQDGVVTVADRATGAVLFEEPSRQFAQPRLEGALVPRVEVEIVADGFSLHYSFRNDTALPKPLPDLRVGPILLGDSVTYQDTRHSCEDVQTDAATHRTPGHNYPINMYAPVWIVRDDAHAAGVSLEYPIMDYRHDARFFMRYHQRSGGWLVDMRLSCESDSDAVAYPAAVPPGQTWDYTVNVRFTPHSDEWVRTLEPYRSFFRDAYGGVRYQRETGPINAVGLSLQQAISQDNPYGFSREEMRPDVQGYGPFVEYVLEREGWPEFMFITPTGHYRENRALNYPFRFTSQWSATPELETAMQSGVGFPRVVEGGRRLGFWWGRSAQVNWAWDDPRAEVLDPTDPGHRALAFAELDRAVEAGATAIGLDTFGYRAIPIWDSYGWLGEMQARHPGVKFVLEPMPSDIMHTRAAGWLRGFNDSEPVDDLDELSFIKGPHVLADFLLPGHETWAAWRYAGHREYLGITPTPEMVEEDAARFASWGYRPFIYTDFELRGNHQAAESWRFTIPDDLQDTGDDWPDDSLRLTDLPPGPGRPDGESGGGGGPSDKGKSLGVSGQQAGEALRRSTRHLRPSGKDAGKQ